MARSVGSTTVLSKEDIVSAVVDGLRPLDFVHAVWEGGAVAFGREDEWSDIDLYVVVDDDHVDDVFAAVEGSLRCLSGIRQKYDVGKTQWPGIFQAFYRVEGASDYHLVDLAVVQLSSDEKLLQPEIHGTAVFHFNKGGVVRSPPLDRESFDSGMRRRLTRLRDRLEMFGVFVQKEIERGNRIEALDVYHRLVLGSLVEVLRMRYGPMHYDFGTHYLRYELPAEAVSRLEELHFVRDMDALQRSYLAALAWFEETADILDGNGSE